MDFSQVILANLFVQMGNNAKGEVEENMLRHMVLTSILHYKKKFGKDYGELVIAYDSRAGSWRKAVFPYYKANRATNRAESPLDWEAIFKSLDKIRQELKDYFGYRIIDVEGAEADDIIGTLVRKYGQELNFPGAERIMILSSDKDFIQLHTYANVRQWSPIQKKFVTHPDPVSYLREHIIKGDSGDGVPNMLSPDDCFVVKSRQKPVSSKKLAEWVKTDQPDVTLTDERVLRNWKRNQQLIDLSFTPESLQNEIVESYLSQAGKKRGDLFNYFINNRLKFLMDAIQDF